MAAILAGSIFGSRKTTIMQKAAISFPQLKEYLQLMIKAGLLETGEEGGRTIFFASDKGKTILHIYREMDKLLPTQKLLGRIS